MSSLQHLVKKARAWKAKIQEVDELEARGTGLPANAFGGKLSLRPHQEDFLAWASPRIATRTGIILADEMGLGKTISSLALHAAILVRQKHAGKCLIVAPLSTLSHWEAESRLVFPKASIVTFGGDEEDRREMKEDLIDADIVITSPYYARTHPRGMGTRRWTTLIVDEAHALKNHEAQLHEVLTEKIHTKYRLLLTGTPVQNKLAELGAVLSAADPEKFPTSAIQAFTQFGVKPDPSVVSAVREILEPFLLRRVKSGVDLGLPPRKEYVVNVPMTTLQRDLYIRALTRDRSAFTSKVAQRSLNSIATALRQIALHPYMLDSVEPEGLGEGEHIVEASAKFMVLDQLLDMLKHEGRKVLIFSGFRRALDIVEDFMTLRSHKYRRIDGLTASEDRATSMAEFQAENSPYFAFLLSTRAGGLGLNLMAASAVIFLDCDWNPQADIQAAARAHRIGQTRDVKIYRLAAANTIDALIAARGFAKLNLSTSVLGDAAPTSPTADNAAQGQKELDAAEAIGFGALRNAMTKGLAALTAEKDRETGPSDNSPTTAPAVLKPGDKLDINSILDQAEELEELVAQDAFGVAKNPTNGALSHFEGVDYNELRVDKADRDALDRVLKVAEEEEASIALAGQLQDEDDKDSRSARKRRRQELNTITPEEMEALKAASVARAAEKAEKAERAAARQRERQAARDKRWSEAGYKSTNVAPDESARVNDLPPLVNGEWTAVNWPLKRVVHVKGTMITALEQPPRLKWKHPATGAEKEDDFPSGLPSLVVIPVNTGGVWGGCHAADADALTDGAAGRLYERAGSMDDLALGSLHMVPGTNVALGVFWKCRKDGTNGIVGLHNVRQICARARTVLKGTAGSMLWPATERDPFKAQALYKAVMDGVGSMGIHVSVVHLPWSQINNPPQVVRPTHTTNHPLSKMPAVNGGTSLSAAAAATTTRTTTTAAPKVSRITSLLGRSLGDAARPPPLRTTSLPSNASSKAQDHPMDGIIASINGNDNEESPVFDAGARRASFTAGSSRSSLGKRSAAELSTPPTPSSGTGVAPASPPSLGTGHTPKVPSSDGRASKRARADDAAYREVQDKLQEMSKVLRGVEVCLLDDCEEKLRSRLMRVARNLGATVIPEAMLRDLDSAAGKQRVVVANPAKGWTNAVLEYQWYGVKVVNHHWLTATARKMRFISPELPQFVLQSVIEIDSD